MWHNDISVVWQDVKRKLLIQSKLSALFVTRSSYSLCLTINTFSAMQKYFKSALHCVEVPATNQNFSAKKCESWFMKYAGKMFPFLFVFCFFCVFCCCFSFVVVVAFQLLSICFLLFGAVLKKAFFAGSFMKFFWRAMLWNTYKNCVNVCVADFHILHVRDWI